MPARFMGSAAAMSDLRSIRDEALRARRRESTASGRANCSPPKPVDEAAAADLAARFETAQDAEEIAPLWGVGLTD